MGIEGTQRLQDWGKKIPVNDNVHITQTNATSRDGEGAELRD